MKSRKTLLMIAAIFILSETLTAQPYQSIFGSTNTSWKIAALNLPGTFTDSMFTLTDTTINLKFYKKIGSSYFQNVAGYLREDSSNSLGYFYSTFDSIEREIYNLNLSVGDSFYFNGAWPIMPGYYLVDSIYTLSGKKHLRFNTFTYWNEKFEFIESVGVNINLDYQSNSLRQNSFLLCNYHNTLQNYLNTNSNFAGCNLITGLNELNHVTISLYPNPTNDIFHVDLFENSEVEIFNNVGCKIFSKYFQKQNLRISFSAIAGNAYGIYFLRIKSYDTYSSAKLIYINN